MSNNHANNAFGFVSEVIGNTIKVNVNTSDSSSIVVRNGELHSIGQIGSYVKIHNGLISSYAVVVKVGISEIMEKQDDNGNSRSSSMWMYAELFGESIQDKGFVRGISSFPSIDSEVFFITDEDIDQIYSYRDGRNSISFGTIVGIEGLSASINIEKIVNRHALLAGNTGSGKSSAVVQLLTSIIDRSDFLSSRVLLFDLHGEYGTAFGKNSKTLYVDSILPRESLYIPFWLLNGDEIVDLLFGKVGENERVILLERILELKRQAVQTNNIVLNIDRLSADTPVPFSIHKLWYDLFIELNATHSERKTGQSIHSVAWKKDSDGNNIVGDALEVVPPQFETQQQGHIFLSNSELSLSRELRALESKLKDPRWSFILNPGPWKPDLEGKVSKDLDELIKSWIGGNRCLTILNLQGIPHEVLSTIVGTVFKLLFELVFWSRNLKSGGRNRPLLCVLEEAHLYLDTSGESSAFRSVRRVAKEGRKYGIGILLVTQRPSDIDQSILSQCGTFFCMRLSNSQDRSVVNALVPDGFAGLLELLPALKTRELVILGDAVPLPVRVEVHSLSRNQRPDSEDPVVFDENSQKGWNQKEIVEDYVKMVLAWRTMNAFSDLEV